MRTFEVVTNCYDEPYGGHRGRSENGNIRLIRADRYEIRAIRDGEGAGAYSIANLVSFYIGDEEIHTLFSYPQEIRLVNTDA